MNHLRQLLPKILSSLLIVSTFSFVVPTPTFAAGTATLYLKPSSATVTVNTNFSVQIRVNVTGTANGGGPEKTNGVTAYLNYDTSKLQWVSNSLSGNAFGLTAENKAEGGVVKISVARNPGEDGVSGDNLVATVTFKAKVSSGSTSVSFALNSQVASSVSKDGSGFNLNILGTKTGGTYSFKGTTTNPPVVNPPATKPPTVSPTPTTSPTPTPTPPATGSDTTGPKISNIRITGQTFKTVTIAWNTDEPASTVIEFGFSTRYIFRNENKALTREHSYTLNYESNGTFLVPGRIYHYRVSSIDKAGNSSVSEDKTFKAKGYTVKVKVLDANGEALKNAKVTLYSDPQTTTTDGSGVATFQDVSAEKHEIVVEFAGKKASQSIIVKEAPENEINAGKLKTQSFDVKVAGISAQSELYRTVGLALMGFGILALAILAIINFRRNRTAVVEDNNIVQ